MRVILLFNYLLLFIAATACSKFFGPGKTGRWYPFTTSSSAPGLNVQLGVGTVRLPPAAPVTQAQVTLDNLAMTTRTGGWADQASVSGLLINNGYSFISFIGGAYSIAGPITLTATSRLYISHYVTNDSAELSVAVGGNPPVNIPAGTALIGWTRTYLGEYPAGVHTVDMQTTGVVLATAYVDGIIAIGDLTLTAGLNGRRWWEQDHTHLMKVGDWGTDIASVIFPFSVSGSTGTGVSYNANTGQYMRFWVDVPAGAVLRIWGPTNPNLGILGVEVDGVVLAGWDQYAAVGSESPRSYKDYTVAAGEHEVELYVTGTKNAASSATTIYVDAVSVPMVGETDENRAIRIIDGIAETILSDGGPLASYDSDKFNMDNDGGYSGMALVLGAARWQYPEHIAAVKRLIEWHTLVIQADGVLNWGYERTGPSTYVPWVSPAYTGLTPSLTGLRSLDAIQSFPSVILALYAAAFPDDTAFIDTHLPTAIKAIDALIANNYDSSNGFFFSSHHFHTGAWHLFEAQYSAGQADVYMGLMAAYSLTGTASYKTLATTIKTNFDSAYWSPVLNLYSVSLSGAMGAAKVRDDVTPYAFTQGWVNWVFGSGDLSHGTTSLTEATTWLQGDGHSILLPGDSEPITNNSSWIAMGLKSSGSDETLRADLKGRLRLYHLETYPDTAYGDSVVLFSNNFRYGYASNGAWAFMALTNQPSPQTWWR